MTIATGTRRLFKAGDQVVGNLADIDKTRFVPSGTPTQDHGCFDPNALPVLVYQGQVPVTMPPDQYDEWVVIGCFVRTGRHIDLRFVPSAGDQVMHPDFPGVPWVVCGMVGNRLAVETDAPGVPGQISRPPQSFIVVGADA